jgi:sugar transferase (PEP-CTERM/EpsH1 system associated)
MLINILPCERKTSLAAELLQLRVLARPTLRDIRYYTLARCRTQLEVASAVYSLHSSQRHGRIRPGGSTLRDAVHVRTDQRPSAPCLGREDESLDGANRLTSCLPPPPASTSFSGSKTRPLRVLHVINSLGLGGTERGVLKLMEGLDASRFDQRLCVVRGADERLATLPSVKGKLFVAGLQTSGFQFLLFRLTKILQSYRPDIVHSRNWGSIEAIAAGKLAGVPVVVHSEHGYELDMLSGLALRRRLLRRGFYSFCDAIFTVSRELQDYHGKQSWFPTERIQVIPNGVDTNLYAPSREARLRARFQFDFPAEAVVLGTVGRLVPIKDQVTLLRAAEQLLRRGLDIRVLLVGSGPEHERLRSYAQESPLLRGKVRFADPTLPVADSFQAMDLFVLPSILEGMSNTLLEAMSSGLACVATAVGGNPELIEPELSGLLFTPGDVAKLSELLQELIVQTDFRNRLAAAARHRVVTHFSLDAMMSNYTKFYAELAARRSALRRS